MKLILGDPFDLGRRPDRAAEEVEQQVSIPVEIVMNGLPHLEHLRSNIFLLPAP